MLALIATTKGEFELTKQNTDFASNDAPKVTGQKREISGWRDVFTLAAIASLLWMAAASAFSFTIRSPLRRELAVGERVQLTDRWFAERAGHLCRMLNPEIHVRRMDLSTSESLMRDGSIVETVSIDCTAENGNHFASFLWVAGSRMLISLVHTMPRSMNPMNQPTIQEASRTVRRWMQVIGMSGWDVPWRALHPPKLEQNHWRIQLVYGRRKAFLDLDSETGGLHAARVTR